MKKLVAFIVSFAGALFVCWTSSFGAYKIFLESRWFGFGDVPSIILGYAVGCINGGMVWFVWHDIIFGA